VEAVDVAASEAAVEDVVAAAAVVVADAVDVSNVST
jgi:hypothetical protein